MDGFTSKDGGIFSKMHTFIKGEKDRDLTQLYDKYLHTRSIVKHGKYTNTLQKSSVAHRLYLLTLHKYFGILQEC